MPLPRRYEHGEHGEPYSLGTARSTSSPCSYFLYFTRGPWRGKAMETGVQSDGVGHLSAQTHKIDIYL